MKFSLSYNFAVTKNSGESKQNLRLSTKKVTKINQQNKPQMPKMSPLVSLHHKSDDGMNTENGE